MTTSDREKRSNPHGSWLSESTAVSQQTLKKIASLQILRHFILVMVSMVKAHNCRRRTMRWHAVFE
jgi:hypothetical protein